MRKRDKNVCMTGRKRDNEHAHDNKQFNPSELYCLHGKLSSQMISLIVDTEHVQEMFIACHTINVYWPIARFKKAV